MSHYQFDLNGTDAARCIVNRVNHCIFLLGPRAVESPLNIRGTRRGVRLETLKVFYQNRSKSVPLFLRIRFFKEIPMLFCRVFHEIVLELQRKWSVSVGGRCILQEPQEMFEKLEKLEHRCHTWQKCMKVRAPQLEVVANPCGESDGARELCSRTETTSKAKPDPPTWRPAIFTAD